MDQEAGWVAIGALAKSRRERLGLKQGDLALYDGPGVSTVGKFERGLGPFPLRTQHQIEKALGWSRGTIEDYVNTLGDYADDHQSSIDYELVHEDIPDMDRAGPQAERVTTWPEEPGDPDYPKYLEALAAMLRLIRPERRADATQGAIAAMLLRLGTSTSDDDPESAHRVAGELMVLLAPDAAAKVRRPHVDYQHESIAAADDLENPAGAPEDDHP